MEYIDNKLCLETNELIPMILERKNYDYHRSAGNFIVHGYGGNGRKVFVEYETMPEKQKQAVIDYYGDPYNYIAKQPILKALKLDVDAQEFYQNYVLPNGSKLPSSNYSLDGLKLIR